MSEKYIPYSAENPHKITVSNEELIISSMLEIQPIIRILERKGITSQAEILEEVKALKAEMEEKIKRNSKEN
jgi:hypothetical protein